MQLIKIILVSVFLFSYASHGKTNPQGSNPPRQITGAIDYDGTEERPKIKDEVDVVEFNPKNGRLNIYKMELVKLWTNELPDGKVRILFRYEPVK